jgi:Chalcone isomerase-like
MTFQSKIILTCWLLFSVPLVLGSTIHVATAAIDAKDYATEPSVFEQVYSRRSDITPISLEGVVLPAYEELDSGIVLYRNGHGIRSFSFYGLSMKMYVASVYSETPLRNADDALDCSGCPFVFHFTFLRSVSKGQVKLAWQKQLDWSVSHTYDGYEQDYRSFIKMFGPMADHGTVTVKFVADETLIWDQGELKGSIRGENFQRAFLSMWFGERAVADDLKVALLGNTSSSQHIGAVAATAA